MDGTQDLSRVRSQGRRRPPVWVAKLTLLCGSVALTLGGFEVALRVLGYQPMTATALTSFFQYSDQTGWIGRPGADCRFATTSFDAHITHGRDGFRSCAANHTDLRDDAEPIWCVGDSFVWGWGIDDGHTFVDLLNAAAAQASTPSRHVYRNLGISGFATVQEFVLLEQLLARDRLPREVWLIYSSNDLYENLDTQDQDPPRPYFVSAESGFAVQNRPVPPTSGWRFKPWLKRNSLAYNFLHFYLTSARKSLKNLRETGELVVPPDPPAEQWQALAQGYGMIQELCRRHGVQMRLIYIPGLAEVDATQPSQLAERQRREHDQALQVADALHLPVLDLTDSFRSFFERRGSVPLAFAHDGHFNPLGHQVTAEAILETLGRPAVARREATPQDVPGKL
ncbi:MAG: SGNH/GDSL hydrolase family protein [Pirellulales bacterium]|nr:SGNH/GDSL hydrolase family protein [Pirellulales bacterium]